MSLTYNIHKVGKSISYKNIYLSKVQKIRNYLPHAAERTDPQSSPSSYRNQMLCDIPENLQQNESIIIEFIGHNVTGKERTEVPQFGSFWAWSGLAKDGSTVPLP